MRGMQNVVSIATGIQGSPSARRSLGLTPFRGGEGRK